MQTKWEKLRLLWRLALPRLPTRILKFQDVDVVERYPECDIGQIEPTASAEPYVTMLRYFSTVQS